MRGLPLSDTTLKACRLFGIKTEAKPMPVANPRCPTGRKVSLRVPAAVFAALSRSAAERRTCLSAEIVRVIERGQTLDAIEQAQTSIFTAQVQIQQLASSAGEALKMVQDSDQKQRDRLQKIVDWIQKLQEKKP